jgi:hypothetical protein
MAPRPLIAVSAAVRSLEEAKGAFSERHKLTPGGNGSLRIEGLGDTDDPRPCDLVPAASGARLVCGDGPGAIEALEPWLARTAPRESYPEDLRISLHLSPVRPTVQSFRKMLPGLAQNFLGGGGGAAAIGQAIEASVNDIADLTNDLDDVTLDVNLSDPGADAHVVASFGGATSLLARLATQAGPAEQPPATFWRLPADADVAYFSHGVDAKAIAHARELVAGVFAAALEKHNMPEADRKAVVDPVMRYLDLYAAPIVYAKGLDLAAVDKADAARGGPNGDQALLQSLAGWSVVGTSETPQNVVKIAKDFAAALARPGVAKWAKDAHLTKPPTATVAPYKAKDLPADVTRLELTFHEEALPTPPPMPAAKGAPKKPPAKPAPPRARVVNMLIVPDGQRAWIVLSPTVELAAVKARALLPNAPDTGTLAKRSGLDALHDGRGTSGGLVTARGVVTPSPFRYIVGEAKMPHGPLFGGLSSTQSRGGTPMTFFTTGDAKTWNATAKVPKESIQDIVKIAMTRF